VSAVVAVNGGIQNIEQSNVLLNEAATAIRAAIASIVTAKKVSGEDAVRAFSQAASMVSSNTSSKGHALSHMCRGRADNIQTVQLALVNELERITTLIVHGNRIATEATEYRNRLAR
jgi:hypothetical protein